MAIHQIGVAYTRLLRLRLGGVHFHNIYRHMPILPCSVLCNQPLPRYDWSCRLHSIPNNLNQDSWGHHRSSTPWLKHLETIGLPLSLEPKHTNRQLASFSPIGVRLFAIMIAKTKGNDTQIETKGHALWSAQEKLEHLKCIATKPPFKGGTKQRTVKPVHG
jgi:hypothetical protein